VEDGSHGQFQQDKGWEETGVGLMLWKSRGECGVVHGPSIRVVADIGMQAVGSYMQ